MPIAETQAGPIYYLARGEAGPPMLLLHGAGGSHRHWGLVARALASEARLYLPDLPGHGRSPGRARRSIAAYGEALEALLETLGIEAACLVGHSLGGAIALWLAARRPQRVSGLGLVASGARLPIAPDLLGALEREPARFPALLAGRLFGPAASDASARASAGELAQVPTEVLLADYQACDAFDAAHLGTIAAPAAIIYGEADRLVPASLAEELGRLLPAARLTAIAGAGHMPMLEAPGAVTAALRALLDDLK